MKQNKQHSLTHQFIVGSTKALATWKWSPGSTLKTDISRTAYHSDLILTARERAHQSDSFFVWKTVRNVTFFSRLTDNLKKILDEGLKCIENDEKW